MSMNAIYKLDKERSLPLLSIANSEREIKKAAEQNIKDATGCDEVFWTTHGSAYPAFITKPTGKDWHKKAQEHYDEGQYYHLMTPKTKTEFSRVVSEAQSSVRAGPSFKESCKAAFPDCCIQIACAGPTHTSLVLKSTGFGMAKGHVLMSIPFNKIEQIRAISIPEGFEEITETQLAELEA